MTGSIRVMISAIWAMAPADCTFRLVSGRGISRFAKKESDIWRVVVLAGVHQGGRDVRVLRELGHDRRDLDEVRSGSDDRENLHATLPDAMTPVVASTSRTGANAKSRSSRRSFASVVPVFTEWRNWATRPTASRGWPGSISHGCR